MNTGQTRKPFLNIILILLTFLLSITPWILVTQRFLVDDPPVIQDEAIMFDISNTIATTGKFATHIYAGAMPGVEEHAFLHPPAYYYLLAIWIQNTGSTLESGRALSVVLGFLCFALFFAIAYLIFHSPWLAAFCTFCLCLDTFFSGATRTIRMDILVLFLFFSSFLLYLMLIRKKTKRAFMLIAIGIFAGLAFLSHPMGSVVSLIIFLSLLGGAQPTKQKIGEILIFFVPMIGAVLIWYLVVSQALDVFFQILAMHAAFKAKITPAVIVMWQGGLLSELLLVSYILIPLLSVVSLYKHTNHAYRAILIAAVVTTIAALGAIAVEYLVYIAPFVLLAGFTALKYSKNTILRIATASTLVLMIAINCFYFLQLMTGSKSQTATYHQFTKLIAQNIAPGTTVLLSTFPDPYFDFVHNPSFRIIEYPFFFIDKKSYADLFAKIDYVVINTAKNKEADELTSYVERNGSQATRIYLPNYYETYVIKLVPVNQRR